MNYLTLTSTDFVPNGGDCSDTFNACALLFFANNAVTSLSLADISAKYCWSLTPEPSSSAISAYAYAYLIKRPWI